RAHQRNKLYRGDVLNVLRPYGYIEPIRIKELYDGKMNPIESAPHPEMEILFSVDGANNELLPPMTFLSRDGDKDEGIKPQN
ncbi:MAG: U32 family peptidase C-terminal domain-containing protein, partial [Clostridiales bacterium]|nr:U32 family peptidase C-terminal domain-containing protein [Clostridiales bacterium]